MVIMVVKMVVKCPHCGEYSEMDKEHMGKFVVCPRCGYKVYTKDKEASIVEKRRGSTFKLPDANLLEKNTTNRFWPADNRKMLPQPSQYSFGI